MKKVIFAGLLVVLASLPVVAGADYNVCFNSLDGDGSGEVTRAEFAETFPGGDAVFEAADADKSGDVSHEEWEEYKESKGFEDTHHD